MTALSLTPGENTLQYERVLAAKNAWGPAEKNTSNGEQKAGDGKPITLNGQVYRQGYGVHANSELSFSLKGTGATCTRFTVDVGVDDEVGSRGSVTFQVFLDGQLRWDTGRITGDSPTGHIALDISGKQELRLVVTPANDGISYDHADWADPRIDCTDNPSAVQLTFDRSVLEVFHKHSASVRATFSTQERVGEPLSLRLEPAEPGRGLELQLLTTRVDFSGPGTATRDITIAAPNMLSNNPDDNMAPYSLIASAGGRDVARALLTVSVYPLNVTARFEPGFLSGRDGETKRVKLIVIVDPPLDAPVPIDFFYPSTGWGPDESDFTRIVTTSPTRGNGGAMEADVDLRFFERPEPDRLPEHRLLDSPSTIVTVGDIAGYRLPVYGNLYARLDLQLIR